MPAQRRLRRGGAAAALLNTIGGTAAGAGNVISGNAQGGIRITAGTFLVSENNAVLRIDPQTGAVLATYATTAASGAAVLGPDGSVYVDDYYNNQILHYDAARQPAVQLRRRPSERAAGP